MHAGLEAWARDHDRELVLEDDGSDPRVAARVHEELIGRGCSPVLGPYGSDTTRAVAHARTGKVVWNHGGAADDVQRLPGIVSIPSPASRYLVAVARAAVALHGVGPVAVLTAPGSFARQAKEGLEREAEALGVRLVAEPKADCILLCGPIDWEVERFHELAGRKVVLGGVSPGLPDAPGVWPDGTLAPVQWHPDLGGPSGVEDYIAAQAYAGALIAERCQELTPGDPLSAARSLTTETFFGRFALDDTGLQIGHRLAVVQWRAGRQELLRPPDR